MPLGYGGYEKDNTLAYSDAPAETPEDKQTRKSKVIALKRQVEHEATIIRRKKLEQIVKARSQIVEAEALQVTEADLEFIHGEEEYEKLQHQKCCDDRFVDFDLEHGRAQLWFIIKGLFPVMLGYAATTIYAGCIIFIDELRLYFYHSSPTYALISLGCWVGLNIFGRLVRTYRFVLPMMLMRALAICNFLASAQLYSEYYIWEILFSDTSTLEAPEIIEMEERLRLTRKDYFPDTWFDLPNDPTKNDFGKREEFTRACFGCLLSFSMFFSLFCMLFGLLICSGRKHLSPHQVTGFWIKRVAPLAGALPSIIVFFVNDYFYFLPGPRSFNFTQTYPIGLLGLTFGVCVSAAWTPLFAGKSCFNVRNHDHLYFGFMFSL